MKAVLIRVALALVVVLLSGCTRAGDSIEVVRVIDGDTIVISGGATVRYIGIDAPERGEPYYLEALGANRWLVEGRSVRLEVDISREDRYGRLLRYVYQDGVFVNAELVREGWARAKAYPPDIRYQGELEAAEREAREARRGIWGGQ